MKLNLRLILEKTTNSPFFPTKNQLSDPFINKVLGKEAKML
jgi:hypothetical protein